MAKKTGNEVMDRLKKIANIGTSYKNDPYYQVMAKGVDAITNGKVTKEIIDEAIAEQKCWGPLMPNYNTLGTLVGELESSLS